MSETDMPIMASSGWVTNADRGIARCSAVVDMISVYPVPGGSRVLRISPGNGVPIEFVLDQAAAEVLADRLRPTQAETEAA